MGAYTCIKPATFAGVKYKPGDTVPEEAIPADRVGAVIRLGLIAEPAQTGCNEKPSVISIPIRMEGGSVEQMEATPESIIEAVAVLQMTADDAVERVKAVTDATALIMIDACDSRKTVKKAAADRAAELGAEAAQTAEAAE